MPSPHALIGELYTYRPSHSLWEISSPIVSVKKLANYLGHQKMVAVLKNGKVVPVENIYTENFAANTSEARSNFVEKNKFSIVFDETDLIQVGVLGCEHTLEFRKCDVKTLIRILQSFHFSIQDPDSCGTVSSQRAS